MKQFATLLALAALVSGCFGGDDDAKQAPPPAPPKPSAAAPKPGLPPAPPAPAAPGSGVTWTWPAEYGEKRSLLTDLQECRAIAEQGATGMGIFKKAWECMESRGWRREGPPPQQQAAQPPAPKPARPAPPLSELWIWSGDPAAPHNVESDAEECNSAKTAGAHPLLQLKQHMDCMMAKGWQVNEEKWKKGTAPQ